MDIKAIDIAEFDYPLPDERIAKHPLSDRAACKLLVRDADGSMHEHRFAELPGLLPEDSLLVYNNTRVINARLRFRKASGAAIEVFCLEPVAPGDYAMSFASNEHCVWMCFVGNSKRWKSGLLEMPLTIAGEQVVLPSVCQRMITVRKCASPGIMPMSHSRKSLKRQGRFQSLRI